MRCPECSVEVSESDAFCGECGSDLSGLAEPPPQESVEATTGVEAGYSLECANCGEPFGPDEQFCSACGTPTGMVASSAQASGGGEAGEKVAAVFSQGGGEVSDRFQRTWSDELMRAPLIFLAVMTLGFLLPLASARGPEAIGEFGGSVTLSDVTTISLVIFLLISVLLLVLLVVHATSPGLGSTPVLIVVAISFFLAVLASVMATFIIAGTAAAGSFLDEIDGAGSVSVGLGTILLLIGSVGLFVTSSRLSNRNPG